MWIRFFAVFCLFSVAICNNIEIAGESAAEIHNAHDGHNHEFRVEHQHVEQHLIPSSEQSLLSPDTTTGTSFSNCLIFAVADNLKGHLTTDNVKPVTVLLQHSIQTCPGLNSTFEVFQKIMGFKGLDFAGVMNFISSLKVHNGTTTLDEEEGEQQIHADVPSTNVQPDESIVEAENDETTDAQDDNENASSNDIESDVQIDEQEETSETPEVENTNTGDNYEDNIPASIESNYEAPALKEDHKDEYRRFWQEENLNNLREAEHLSEEID
uniref:Uncharacterized protein n=1 Tax=Panagrolaimus davidi TaxID=227884 RepID=A0A914P968_9BILA